MFWNYSQVLWPWHDQNVASPAAHILQAAAPGLGPRILRVLPLLEVSLSDLGQDSLILPQACHCVRRQETSMRAVSDGQRVGRARTEPPEGLFRLLLEDKCLQVWQDLAESCSHGFLMNRGS